MKWRGTAYTAFNPRWGWEPLSGKGALRSGRFNPFGSKTLYLALSIDGLVAEVSHGLAYRLEALKVLTVDVEMDDLVDLRSKARRRAEGVELEDLGADWARLPSSEVTPISWSIAQGYIERGASGLLVPSFAPSAKPDAANLVVWRWGDSPAHRVELAAAPEPPGGRRKAKDDQSSGTSTSNPAAG